MDLEKEQKVRRHLISLVQLAKGTDARITAIKNLKQHIDRNKELYKEPLKCQA